MRLGFLVITLTSSVLLVACNKTEYQFGNTVPAPYVSTHDNWGNVVENSPMNVLAPTSENTPENTNLLPKEPVKVVQPKKIKPVTNTITTATPMEKPLIPATPPGISIIEQKIAQPAPGNWQPNEALLIRGNELLAGLQKELGKKPTLTEMHKRLQTHMGLNAAQAQQVIASLGL